METYFEIDPETEEIIGERHFEKPLRPGFYCDRAASRINGKPYLVRVVVQKPARDPKTEVREGPQDSYNPMRGVARRVFPVRKKTAEEMEAERKARASNPTHRHKALERLLIAKGVVTKEEIDAEVK